MEKRRPQLSLDELHQLRWLLGNVLALISIGTVFYLDLNAWIVAGAAATTVLLTLAHPALPAYVPPLVHRLAFPFIVLFFAWDLFSTAEVLPAMIRLDLLLLLYRGSSYRKKRDDLQIIVLGLFLVMMAGVLTVSLAFAAQILVFTGVTLAFLFAITLTEGVEGESAPGRWRPSPRRASLRPWSGPRCRRASPRGSTGSPSPRSFCSSRAISGSRASSCRRSCGSTCCCCSTGA